MSNFVNLLDIIYPVGSLYFSTSSVSPASTVGGTWEQIKDANIAATGDKFASEYIGSYKINKKQLPHHAHILTGARTKDDLSQLDKCGDSELGMWTGSVDNAVNNASKHQTQKMYNLNAGDLLKLMMVTLLIHQVVHQIGLLYCMLGECRTWVSKTIIHIPTLVTYGNEQPKKIL